MITISTALEFINGVKEGRYDTFYVIMLQKQEDDEDGSLIGDKEVFFAGLTLEEAKREMNERVSQSHPDKFTIDEFRTFSVCANPNMFDEYDEEDIHDDPLYCVEAVISQAFEGDQECNWVDHNELNNENWMYQNIGFDYQSIFGALVLVWHWNNYYGYNRNIRDLYICDSPMTEEITRPDNEPWHPNITILISKEDLDDIRKYDDPQTVFEEAVFEKLDKMAMWKNISFANTLIENIKL